MIPHAANVDFAGTDSDDNTNQTTLVATLDPDAARGWLT